ncbi:MAG TPA: TonB-dependent receptor, partial [Bryobacteraceae bacterium]|nr:TonB-dependent receptor [Bryobacteraceae bacterium]
STDARTISFTAGGYGQRTFHSDSNTYYSMARLDFLATQKIRVYGAWTYQYNRSFGSLPSADDVSGLFNPASTTNPDLYNDGIGSVNPNIIYNVGADITINPNLVATTRFGYFFFNSESRGVPAGLRYIYRDTNYPYSTGNAPAPAGLTALNGAVLPSQFVNSTGWSNIGANTLQAYDAWKRWNLQQDLAWFKRFAGTHNFKFGYGFNHATDDILSGYQTADVYVAYNDQYYPSTNNGLARCAAIVAQNKSLYGAPGGVADGSQCQGLWGTVNLRDLGTTGKVGGWNHSLYAQDAWTINRRLTLNIGVRLDKENLPSYDTLPGFQGISFGWGQKVAPRFGAAYDLFGNGKIKLFGSFGYFYDIMKFQLPRGSFGGDYWHDCVYALDTPDFTTIIPQRDSQGHYCPLGGGSTPAVGQIPNARFIENVDYREPANDPTQIGSLGKTGLVDPKLLPMKQHLLEAGMNWAVSPTIAFEARYSRKRLDRTIEDAGTITQDGEVYYIVNPGFNVNTIQANCNGCPQNPKAIRDYDGLELRLTKRMTHNFYGSFSYTYSRLWGNYSGLTSTDVSDGIGRNGANTDRAFDEPFMSFDAHGHDVSGLLGTDRPNTVKIDGYYNLKWWKLNSMIGFYQQAYSGTPLSSYLSVWGAPVFVEGRGNYVSMTRDNSGNFVAGNVSVKRTPMFSQSDISYAQDFHVSKSNERLVARIGANCINCFNQHSPVVLAQNLFRSGQIKPGQCGTAGTNCTAVEAAQAFDYGAVMTKGYDYVGLANSSKLILNSTYGMAQQWQNPRTLRVMVIFTF